MHLGATLASGHYIAYVRASPDTVWDYTQCQRVSTVERNKKKGILKFLRRGNESKNGDVYGGVGTNGSEVGGASTCRSANCCGIRGGFVSSCLDGSSTSSSVPSQRSLDSGFDSSEVNSAAIPGGESSSASPDDLWLECDDESIQVITRKQFEEILSAKQGATTPYLLFYQKV
jgi:ubiquitin carboxyl-terminal hydrolase 1